ncbi:MAG: hypothetical protein ACXWVS_03245 [Hyphomicrobium sp.]
MSTQKGFGRLLVELSRTGGTLAERIVTTSPDVTLTTNLGGWVNQRLPFGRHGPTLRRKNVRKAMKGVEYSWQIVTGEVGHQPGQ